MNKTSERRLLILNKEELYIRKANTRREFDHRRVLDILRLAGIQYPGGIKRVHRVGTYKAPNPNRNGPPARPTLVEFVVEQTSDLLLSRSVLLAQQKGRYQIAPDGPNAREVGMNPDKIKDQVQTRGISSGSRAARIPGVSPGVVVIEDVLEDEQWQSCLQGDNVDEEASLRFSKEPLAEVAHQKDAQATSTAEKTCCPLRGLYPRPKQEGSMGNA
ncbi:unnamed protein product [Echinostoma caproni]|uniref:Transposase n=1 Tax=Echinostoma caproni TaxID=27848 RepID=A0A183B2N9_9TREM|nr:unnamed protein product [Echinostoma caproni]